MNEKGGKRGTITSITLSLLLTVLISGCNELNNKDSKYSPNSNELNINKTTENKFSNLIKNLELNLNTRENISCEELLSIGNLKIKTIYLSGLSKLTNEKTQIISTFDFENINLSGLNLISNKQAKLISKLSFKEIKLEGLRVLTKKQKQILSNSNSIIIY